MDLRAFFELGQAVATSPAPAIGDRLWRHLGSRLPATAFVLYVYDAQDDTLVPIYASASIGAHERMDRIPLGERLSGWVAATGQTVMNSDARLDLDEPAREHSRLRSALAVPITASERLTGVFSFYAEASNAFSDSHRRFVEAAGKAIARSMPQIVLDFAPQVGDDDGCHNGARVLRK